MEYGYLQLVWTHGLEVLRLGRQDTKIARETKTKTDGIKKIEKGSN